MVNLYIFSWTVFLFSAHETMGECLDQKALIERGPYEERFWVECIDINEKKNSSEPDQAISARANVYFTDPPSLQQ
tara:strand:+ start:270 stop:497 length:228 start_codon:yes stop_codon:yes gene_type:complete